MEVAVQIASVLGGFGTLIVAWLVYQFGRQQADRSNILAERQHELDRQTLRLNLLDRRLSVLSDVREVWTDYMMHARPQPEMTRKLLRALMEARLIYPETVVSDLDVVATSLLSLERNYARQTDAENRGRDEKKRRELLEKQFEIEDALWPILEPLLKKMEASTRVEEETPRRP